MTLPLDASRVASRYLEADDNEPTNEALWERCKETAKARYTKWPSAYAVGHALKLYKDEGGKWKKKAALVHEARGKAKKDVGHGGLDEWFSGHGEGKSKNEGEATWGDWVAISPVKKKIKTELADGSIKTETVYPGDIVGPCGVSEDENWKDVTKGGKDPLKCMPRQKAHDMDKAERAELAKAKMRAEKSEGNGKKPVMTPTFQKDKEAALSARIASRYLSAKGKYDDIDFQPPKSVASEAEKGLKYREKASPSNKGGLTSAEAGQQGIGSGVQRAVNLKNRDNVTPETISKMLGFFARHEKNKSIAPENRDKPWNDKGHVAWLLWGGDAGRTWAEKVKAQMDRADEKSKTAAPSPATSGQISYAKSLIEQGLKGIPATRRSPEVPAWIQRKDVPTDAQIAKMDSAAISVLIDSLKSRKPFKVERYGNGGFKIVPKLASRQVELGGGSHPSPVRVAARFLWVR